MEKAMAVQDRSITQKLRPQARTVLRAALLLEPPQMLAAARATPPLLRSLPLALRSLPLLPHRRTERRVCQSSHQPQHTQLSGMRAVARRSRLSARSAGRALVGLTGSGCTALRKSTSGAARILTAWR